MPSTRAVPDSMAYSSEAKESSACALMVNLQPHIQHVDRHFNKLWDIKPHLLWARGSRPSY